MFTPHRIELKDAERVDTVTFKGNGTVFNILSFLLGIFSKEWRCLTFKPWHMGKLWRRTLDGWLVFEGVSPRSKISFYSNAVLSNVRIYRLTEHGPTDKFMYKCEQRYLGKPYDVAVYGGTMFQYLLLRFIEWFQNTFIRWHKFTISLWRVLNDRLTCWELCEAVDRDYGIDWCARSRYPMITDFLRYVGELE